MVGGAAGHNVQAAWHGQSVQLRQAHGAVVGAHAAREPVGDHAGLFKNFLKHEVAVAAFLRGLHVPLDGLHLVLHRAQVRQFEDGIVRGGGAHQLAVFQKNHLPGVRQKGRDVRGHKVLARAQAEDERGGHACGVDDAGLIAAHEAHGVGPVGLAQGRGKGVQQVWFGFAALGNEVDQHLGVRLRAESVAFGRKVRLDFQVVFNDAVVHHGQGPIVGAVGVGVAFGGHAVGGPAGVAHGAGGRGDAFFVGQFFFQRSQFARGPHHVQRALAQKGHTGGIIAAVFQTAQTLHHYGNRGPVARIADNAAHGVSP